MILPFKQKFDDGTQTYFVDKIWESYFRNNLVNDADAELCHYIDMHRKKFGCDWDFMDGQTRMEFSKDHSIRDDKKNRWRKDMPIHFFINNRSSNSFRFAPVIRCKAVQKISMCYDMKFGEFDVIVDGCVFSKKRIEVLAKRDGFESLTEFKNFFIPKMRSGIYGGTIIHWTDKLY